MVEDEAEALQFVERQEPLPRLRPVAAHVAAGVGALGPEVPELGPDHHHRQHRMPPKKGRMWFLSAERLLARVAGFQRGPWRRMNSSAK